ncbi:TetR family transcriptional regulator [Sphaerisporangium rufum]|uniref:TetR family transcriptional regulator n=1 Tax=Sphaerisporangium rufum TaxID=1381558 RepID=A0A919R4Y6_9ACTN|nr:TetR/AcrR family transcriptional regulator [Sphaerisporangium rufum]GII79624.1 TetR family transcriptional regulator [Sphaerisporangium rufum]
MEGTPGLRERKKQQTRQLISDVATTLFVARGFDAVTVAEVAAAADVSAKTVFNYFPRKEDLFFDRMPEAEALITQAVRARPAGTGPLAALRELFIGLARDRHPLSGVGDYRRFWQVVLDSPALQARIREAMQELEELLAALLAEATGAPPGDPWCRLAGALVVTAYRTAYAVSAGRVLSGEPAEAVAADHLRLLTDAFDALDRALPGY